MPARMLRNGAGYKDIVRVCFIPAVGKAGLPMMDIVGPSNLLNHELAVTSD